MARAMNATIRGRNPCSHPWLLELLSPLYWEIHCARVKSDCPMAKFPHLSMSMPGMASMPVTV